jgi:hypothetical protein
MMRSSFFAHAKAKEHQTTIYLDYSNFKMKTLRQIVDSLPLLANVRRFHLNTFMVSSRLTSEHDLSLVCNLCLTIGLGFVGSPKRIEQPEVRIGWDGQCARRAGYGGWCSYASETIVILG